MNLVKTQSDMKARKIRSTFEISEDYDNAGVVFKIGNKTIGWSDLTYKEQVKMLNAWAGMYELFYRFLKEEDGQ